MRMKIDHEMKLKRCADKMMGYLNTKIFSDQMTNNDKDLIKALADDCRKYLLDNKNDTWKQIEAKQQEIDD